MFARHGIPNIIKSDNGSQFSSSDFKTFAREWDFKHIPHLLTMLNQTEKSRKQLTQPNKSSSKQCSTTRILTSLYSTGRILRLKGSISTPVQRLMGRRTMTLLPTSARLLKPKLPKPAKDIVTRKREKQAHY